MARHREIGSFGIERFDTWPPPNGTIGFTTVATAAIGFPLMSRDTYFNS